MTRLQMPIIPGDTVYFLFNDSVQEAIVGEVVTRSTMGTHYGISTTYAYHLVENPADPQYKYSRVTADKLFLTKQELLESL